jgi:glutamate synthase domain-containing protein 2
VLSILFNPAGGAKAFEAALEQLLDDASQAVRDGTELLIVSDRGVDRDHAPLPALLSTAGIHHRLLRDGLRPLTGLIVETGEAREIMHFALLLGYGASAINPYLAFETLADMRQSGLIEETLDPEDLIDNYIKAVKKGLLKTFSRMGISTLRSYRCAQIFEAIGLNQEVVAEYFTGTASRLGGLGVAEIARETLERFHRAFEEEDYPMLAAGGRYHYRQDGERHLMDALTMSRLQHAVRTNDRAAYDEFASRIDRAGAEGRLVTLRGLLRLKKADKPLNLDEVEPASEIVKRFATGAMSFGSISKEAHECLAIAMNRLGAMSNTGEGGEDPERFIPLPSGDSLCSKVKQVASGRFGVTIEYLANAQELQIKMAQGAKPGEGGQLPGHKVDHIIARVRHSTPGVSLISPPPHHDIYSIEDLAQLIFDLKNANPKARVSVKLVSEVGVGTVAAGVAKAKADMVLISGHDGGTGASPLTSIKSVGIPWELGLAETQQALVANGLRDRIRVQTDGQLRTGRDVVIAALLGAEEYGFATIALVAMGCCMLRKHRHPGRPVAQGLSGQARACHELLHLRGRAGPLADGADRLPLHRRDDRTRGSR